MHASYWASMELTSDSMNAHAFKETNGPEMGGMMEILMAEDQDFAVLRKGE